MSNPWWRCKTCGKDCYTSEHVMEHRLTTGHVGATLVTVDCPPGPGSTEQGRARARRIFEQARRDAEADR
jgi:hypothetical protein